MFKKHDPDTLYSTSMFYQLFLAVNLKYKYRQMNVNSFSKFCDPKIAESIAKKNARIRKCHHWKAHANYKSFNVWDSTKAWKVHDIDGMKNLKSNNNCQF